MVYFLWSLFCLSTWFDWFYYIYEGISFLVARSPDDSVHIYIDNSNLFIEGSKVVGQLKNVNVYDDKQPNFLDFYVDHGLLVMTILNGRKMAVLSLLALFHHLMIHYGTELSLMGVKYKFTNETNQTKRKKSTQNLFAVQLQCVLYLLKNILRYCWLLAIATIVL